METINKKIALLLILLSLLPVVGSLIIVWISLFFVESKIVEYENRFDSRVETIVKNTLQIFRDDLVNFSRPVNANRDMPESTEKKVIKLEGANLSTFEDHFYIDNVPFFKGDVIAPYGLATLIGRDLVVFDDLNGGIVFLGKKLPPPKMENRKEDNQIKNSPSV